MRFRLLLAAIFAATSLAAQQPNDQPATPTTALTIYNENFAVARTQIALDLHPGINEVTTTEVTSQLEPDSVVLRDPGLRGATAKQSFQILEQSYDAAVVNQEWMLRKYEGKTIAFSVGSWSIEDGHLIHVPDIEGKIIRAPQQGNQYPQNLGLYEVEGKMRFQLPGIPLFPASTDELLLKPTLRWLIDSERAQKLSAELAYITGGLSWEATYNVVAPNTGNAAGKQTESNIASEEKADILGWVTIRNQSGTDFPKANIKLMAGDVAKIAPRNGGLGSGSVRLSAVQESVFVSGQVTQKAFDDFHLYDLNRAVSLRDGEIKQVQFVDAAGVTLTRRYIYDGASDDRQPVTNFGGAFIQQQNYGLNSGNTKVHIVEEFKNTKSNNLGIPLPAGRIRLYRRDTDGQMEFVGESIINHTPTEDTVKISTGSAFDLKGSRRQTDFLVNQNGHTLVETFEIKLTNQKPEPVSVAVVEHLYRGDNWEIKQKSADYTKLDSHTIQIPVLVPAKGEATFNSHQL